MDDATADSLFWEIFTSYENEDFYKGLGDLLLDDFNDLSMIMPKMEVEQILTTEEDDFAASVTLPYVYKQNFSTSVAADGVEDNPHLRISEKKASTSEYEIITVEQTYDPSVTKQEITYFDSGYANLANTAKSCNHSSSCSSL